MNAALPRRRRLAFGVVAVVLVLLVVELGCVVGFWLATGSPFTWARASSARSEARTGVVVVTGTADPEVVSAQRAAIAGCAVHPYLGYVYEPRDAAAEPSISSYGFVDRSPLRQRSDDRFVIAVVGGSVALQMSLYAEQALIASVQASAKLAGRVVEVVRLGLGGFKQPQQLFAVQLASLLGGEFDCVVNLDGFNEVALVDENVPLGVPAWFPRSWARLLDTVPTPEQQLRLGHLAVLREERAAAIASAEGWWWSPTAQLWWLLRDRSVARRIGELQRQIEAAAAAPSFAVRGPGTANATLPEARREMAAIWRRCSVQLHALCAAQGTLYFHFLQPNQYLRAEKPIGPEEESIAIRPGDAWGAAVVEAYPILRREGEALVATGVAFHDLTGLFRDHPEPLYVDTCCHLGRRGYEIMARFIGDTIRARLDLTGVELRELRVSPPELTLDSPLTLGRFVVFGRAASGREVDVTGTGLGTRLAADAGLELRGDGHVRATRRGSHRLVVTHGQLSQQIQVLAAWPDVVVASDGQPAGDGSAPRLELVAATAEVLELRCSGLPSAGLRFLGVGARPVLARMPAPDELAGVESRLLPQDGGEGVYRVAAPAANGQPLYLRVVVLAAEGMIPLAASNTVVVTRGP